jgi:hypothetical protein
VPGSNKPGVAACQHYCRHRALCSVGGGGTGFTLRRPEQHTTMQRTYSLGFSVTRASHSFERPRDNEESFNLSRDGPVIGFHDNDDPVNTQTRAYNSRNALEFLLVPLVYGLSLRVGNTINLSHTPVRRALYAPTWRTPVLRGTAIGWRFLRHGLYWVWRDVRGYFLR